MLEMPELWHLCQGELHTGTETNQRDRCMLQVEKLEEWNHSAFDTRVQLCIELQDLKFSLLGFNLALAQYFLTVPRFLSFGMTVYILCHCIMEVGNLTFYFMEAYS